MTNSAPVEDITLELPSDEEPVSAPAPASPDLAPPPPSGPPSSPAGFAGLVLPAAELAPLARALDEAKAKLDAQLDAVARLRGKAEEIRSTVPALESAANVDDATLERARVRRLLGEEDETATRAEEARVDLAQARSDLALLDRQIAIESEEATRRRARIGRVKREALELVGPYIQAAIAAKLDELAPLFEAAGAWCVSAWGGGHRNKPLLERGGITGLRVMPHGTSWTIDTAVLGATLPATDGVVGAPAAAWLEAVFAVGREQE